MSAPPPRAELYPRPSNLRSTGCEIDQEADSRVGREQARRSRAVNGLDERADRRDLVARKRDVAQPELFGVPLDCGDALRVEQGEQRVGRLPFQEDVQEVRILEISRADERDAAGALARPPHRLDRGGDHLVAPSRIDPRCPPEQQRERSDSAWPATPIWRNEARSD